MVSYECLMKIHQAFFVNISNDTFAENISQ